LLLGAVAATWELDERLADELERAGSGGGADTASSRNAMRAAVGPSPIGSGYHGLDRETLARAARAAARGGPTARALAGRDAACRAGSRRPGTAPVAIRASDRISNERHPLTRQAARSTTRATAKSKTAVERCPRPYGAAGAVPPMTARANRTAMVLMWSGSSMVMSPATRLLDDDNRERF
jgi:hypothetical protein